ncbi:ThiF family adenylyltransferase [Metabacillus herbersteinensis]|uniref:ThiF family adenylyltransferase n=1 Tax=Metabacillus herbersteinensis TaxID=283816 RepID=A0ABV6GJ79_9BACI
MSKTISLLVNDHYYKKTKIYPFICQIGTGGNGGYVTQQIAQMMSIFQIKGHYLIVDPDRVEEKNLKNQLFIEADIGKKKADVLAKRYSAAYNIPISSYSESYIEDIQSLKNLFNTDYQQIGSDYEVLYIPLIIGCVDNSFTRRVLHEFFESSRRCIYLDVGNGSVKVPNDFRDRPRDKWTKEEIESYDESGWDGQVVCGLRLEGKTILPSAVDVFPDFANDHDEIAPSQIACSNLVSMDPQRLITNRTASLAVATYMNELFESATISKHMTFFHAKEGYMKSMPVYK